MAGNSKPLFAFTDLRGVDGFVPFDCDVVVVVNVDEPGVGLYVTGLEEEDAVDDCVEVRYDMIVSGQAGDRCRWEISYGRSTS
jgi:hypothetical protein